MKPDLSRFRSLLLVLTGTFICPFIASAQTYVHEAQQIIRYAELKANGTSLTQADASNIWKAKTSQTLAFETTDGDSENDDIGIDDLIGEGDAEAETPSTNGTSTTIPAHIEKEITKELVLLNALMEDTLNPFKGDEYHTTYNDFPTSFKYLDAMIQVAEQQSQRQAAEQTSGALGSLLGISQGDILQGITEWALSRAQEELMQAFLREWLEALDKDPLLKEIFPNTLTMLRTSEVTTLIADGNAWKSTFQQDLDNIPVNIRNIAHAAFDKAKVDSTDRKRVEITATLGAGGVLYQDIRQGKKPAEIMIRMGKKAYALNVSKDLDAIATIDRTLIGADVLLHSIKDGKTGSKFVRPQVLLELTEQEAKAFWCLIYLRHRDQLRMALKLETVAREQKTYRSVMEHIHWFKADIAGLSENITGMIEIINGSDKSAQMDRELFHRYSSLTLSTIQTNIEILGNFSGMYGAGDPIKYGQYIKGIEYLSLINEGVMAKEYGQVVLNSINTLTWILSEIDTDGKEDLERSINAVNKYGKLMSNIILAKSKDDIKAALDEAAMKRGGYMVRQKSYFSASVTMYPGYEFGWEDLDVQGTDIGTGNYMGLTLPIGIELAVGTNWRPIGAVGIFLQAFDLGAIMNYSLSTSNDSVTVSNLPEFEFKSVFSPGGAISFHLSNNPITFGYSVTYSPELRKVSAEDLTMKASVLQHGIFIAVDLNVFPIYSSKSKYKLGNRKRTRSMQAAYEQ